MSDPIRIDEPSFVARYRESRRAREGDARDAPPDRSTADSSTPSYVRAYRSRTSEGGSAAASSSGDAEIVPTAAVGQRSTSINTGELANDVFLVRHGEVDALDESGGLSEQGRWQAASYGRRLATEFADGERVVIRHADSPRAAETAHHIASGLTAACTESGSTIHLDTPSAASAFANFRFAGPTGPIDISDAFGRFHAADEAPWRIDRNDEPLWAFELQRFWQLQIAGGDPVQLWLTTPSIHAEPAAMVVRRVWNGLRSLGDEHPGARLIVATHGGVVRAFAIAALGYDPGDPYNAEHVRVKILAGRDDAVVSYRNRHQEISVPDIADLPVWKTKETWQPPARTAAE